MAERAFCERARNPGEVFPKVAVSGVSGETERGIMASRDRREKALERYSEASSEMNGSAARPACNDTSSRGAVCLILGYGWVFFFRALVPVSESASGPGLMGRVKLRVRGETPGYYTQTANILRL